VEVMNRYSKERKAFGSPLNHFGQIQKNIAESYAEYMAGECTKHSRRQTCFISEGLCAMAGRG
jgi:alkylation response protein AidB-like acyl-CoA dehydrogenase